MILVLSRSWIPVMQAVLKGAGNPIIALQFPYWAKGESLVVRNTPSRKSSTQSGDRSPGKRADITRYENCKGQDASGRTVL